MRLDREAVRGIMLKVNRAHHLSAQIKAAQDAWNERQPYRADVEQADPDGAKYVIRLRLDEPIPTEWSVVFGELVHDLRSALDQCVYALTVARQRADIGSTQFPIFTQRVTPGDRRPGFANISKRHPDGVPGSGLRMIRGVGPGPRAYIESLQPYPQRGRQENYALRVLHDLWNQDKHRVVQLWGFGLEHIEPNIGPHIIIPGRQWIRSNRGRVIQDKAIVGTMHFDPPRKVEMKPIVQGRIATKNLHPTKRPFGNNLTMIYDATVGVVEKLITALRDQDAEIDPDSAPTFILPRGVEPLIPERWP